MRIGLAQTDIILGRKEENLMKALSIIEKSDADLILFPEVFTTGFDYEKIDELGEKLYGQTVKKLEKASKGKIIAGSIIEKEKDKIYNTFLLIENKKLLGFYRKIHVFQREKSYFSEGKEVVVSDTSYGRVGLSTCYDLRFPELYRELMKKGVILGLLCANFPAKRKEHWINLVTARAIENQYFIAACNRTGKDKLNEYEGNSMIISPWGEVLAKAGIKEELLECEIDLEEVKKIRKEFPVLGDRKL